MVDNSTISVVVAFDVIELSDDADRSSVFVIESVDTLVESAVLNKMSDEIVADSDVVLS